MISRDQNSAIVGSGISSSDATVPLMFRVDPVTSYLLVHAAVDTLTPTSATKCGIDQNNRKTCYGISSVDSKTLIPIRTDTNGTLLVQFS